MFLISGLVKRAKMVTDSKLGHTARLFALAELFCIPISFLTIIYLFVKLSCNIIGYQLPLFAPPWVTIYFKPVLSAAAIGYITNWLAIQMLFRPYTKKAWLFFWPQGLLPKNQAKIAHTLAESVIGQLLKPEALVEEFNSKIRDYLGRPEVMETIKNKAIVLAEKYGESLITTAFNFLGQGFERILAQNITPETLYTVWDNYIEPKLQDEKTRAFCVDKIVDTLQEAAPELGTQIKQALKAFLEQKLQKAPKIMGMKETIVNLILTWADDETINKIIIDFLGKPETIEKLKELFVIAARRGSEWLRAKDTREQLAGFTVEVKEKILILVNNYLHDNATQIVLAIINSPQIWDWLATTGRPYLQENLSAYIDEHKQDILDRLQLDQRVESAVKKMSAQQFHNMIDRLAAEHLGAIQVLGFFLGGIVGLLQTI